jgi:hypothetical protein
MRARSRLAVPTPDPAMLRDEGAKAALVWNYPPGTFVVAFFFSRRPFFFAFGGALFRFGALRSRRAGGGEGGGVSGRGPRDPASSPSPPPPPPPPPLPGVPTPDPVLLVEIAPPRSPDAGSTTTLKWGAENNDNARPSPAELGAPTTLKWNYPPGAPTPDPALLKGVAAQLTWGYPPGVPTPGKQGRTERDG